MAKLTAPEGNIGIFAGDALATERTVFGSTSQSDNINDQFTLALLRGWGIVGPNDQPTLQDFNAMGFVLGYLSSYLFENGIAEFSNTRTYYEGSLINVSGAIYKSLQNDNVGNDPLTEPTFWENIFNIPDNSITNAKLANMAGNTVKVRANATDGVSTDLVMPASTFLARLSSGNLKAASVGEIVNLLGFAKSLGQNSYIKLPDSNIYIQFGRVSQSTAGDIIHTFPITFPNNVLMVNGLLNAAMTTLDVCSVHTITRSGCCFSRRRMIGNSGRTEPGNPDVWWIAIGN